MFIAITVATHTLGVLSHPLSHFMAPISFMNEPYYLYNYFILFHLPNFHFFTSLFFLRLLNGAFKLFSSSPSSIILSGVFFIELDDENLVDK